MANNILSNSYVQYVTPSEFSEENYYKTVCAELGVNMLELAEALDTSQGRKMVCSSRPLLFALIYLRPTFEIIPGKNSREVGEITMSEMSLDVFRSIAKWLEPPTELKANRHIIVAPRDMGKSSLFFKLLPLMLACTTQPEDSPEFICAFSAKHAQSKARLNDLRNVFNTPLIQRDYPHTSARMRGAFKESDTSISLLLKSGLYIYTAGISSGGISGQLIDDHRPSLILLDDVEQSGEAYSQAASEKTLQAVREVVLALNQRARVFMVGTATGYGSLVHQAVRPDLFDTEWLKQENFQLHHYKPVVSDRNGNRQSAWPKKWSLKYLDEEASISPHVFHMNFLNTPLSADEAWFEPGLIKVDENVPNDLFPMILSLDPAVTAKKASDYSGISVVGWHKPTQQSWIVYADQHKLGPEEMKKHLALLLDRFPGITHLLCESTQGKDFLKAVLKPEKSGIRWLENAPSESKDQRTFRLLDQYQRKKIIHGGHFPAYVAQVLGWSGEKSLKNDDIIDSVSQVMIRLDKMVSGKRGTMRFRT